MPVRRVLRCDDAGEEFPDERGRRRRSSPATRPTGPARRCCRCCTWCSPRRGTSRPAGVGFCAELLGLNKAQVGAVATFYTMYKREPDRRLPGQRLHQHDVRRARRPGRSTTTLSEHLGVGHDETTADGKITLEHAECLAACDYGPVMTVNYDFFDRVDAAGRARRGRGAAGRRAGRCRPAAPGCARSRRCRCSSPASPTTAPARSPTGRPATPPCAACGWPQARHGDHQVARR